MGPSDLSCVGPTHSILHATATISPLPTAARSLTHRGHEAAASGQSSSSPLITRRRSSREWHTLIIITGSHRTWVAHAGSRGASSEARGPTARVPTISPGGAASITPPHQIIAGGYGRRPTIGRRPAACGPCRTSCGGVFIRRSPRLNTALRPRARIGSRPGLAQIRCRTGGGDRGRALPTSRIGRALACAADGRPCSGPGTE